MKKLQIVPALAAAMLVTPAVQAGHDDSFVGYGQVTDVQPLVETVETRRPVERCYDRPVRRHSGSATGTILGAVIGGVIGNQFGHGRGRDAATVAGALLGGSIGRDHSRNGEYSYRHQRRCETDYEISRDEHVVGYRVQYRFRGRDFETVTDSHPGERIPVRVQIEPLADGRHADYRRADSELGQLTWDENDTDDWY